MASGARTCARCRTASVPGGKGGVAEIGAGGDGGVEAVVGNIAGAAIDDAEVVGGGGGGAIVDEEAVDGGGGGGAGAVLVSGVEVGIAGGVLVAVKGGPVKIGAVLPDEVAVEAGAGI